MWLYLTVTAALDLLHSYILTSRVSLIHFAVELGFHPVFRKSVSFSVFNPKLSFISQLHLMCMGREKEVEKGRRKEKAIGVSAFEDLVEFFSFLEDSQTTSSSSLNLIALR